MKFTKEAFTKVITNPQYEGADTYLVDDNKNQIDYHIYVCLIISGNVAALICEKMPASNNPDNFEIYEFNGNKLLEHNVVRIKPMDKEDKKYNMLIEGFKNKKLFND